MDFITDVPLLNRNTYLLIIKDQFSKNVIFELIPFINIKIVIERFINYFVRYYGWPKFIINNRGFNWTGRF